MGYKPKIGDLVEVKSKWLPDKQLIGVVVKINKNPEWNGTINVKMVFDDEKEMRAVFIGDVKLLSRAA